MWHCGTGLRIGGIYFQQMIFGPDDEGLHADYLATRAVNDEMVMGQDNSICAYSSDFVTSSFGMVSIPARYSIRRYL